MKLSAPQRTLRRIVEAKRKMKKEGRVVSRMPDDEWTLEARLRLLGKVNDAERHIESLLADLPLRYARERPIQINGRRYFVDFLVTSFGKPRARKVVKARIAIEVDGGYHFTPEQQQKDREKDAALLKTSRVWSILRIRASKAMTMNSAQLLTLMQGHKRGMVRFHY